MSDQVKDQVKDFTRLGETEGQVKGFFTLIRRKGVK